ncbi:MAG: hypothetical protein WCY58_05705 [Mariniphaga sp.]|nr:hypothetical protein [Mariniphaga sp.]MDD4224762.1 hypothetical protein [Mariniphaga sp.]
MSAFLTLDAARAAAHHLYFPHQWIQDGLCNPILWKAISFIPPGNLLQD